jgi:hypothetical protein
MSFRWMTIALCCLTMAGCGSSIASMAPPETVVVTGKAVMASGQPITGARIRFAPAEGATGAESYAELKNDGTFTLQSFGGKDGTMPGVYRVAVYGKGATSVPAKLQNVESSTIKIEITKETKDLGTIKFQ